MRTFTIYLLPLPSGNVYALTGDFFPPELHLRTSSDKGETWTEMPGAGIDECWTFIVDSCDERNIVTANEAAAFPTDLFSEIFRTYDAGKTWNSMLKYPQSYLTGCITGTMDALFVQTKNMILRSTDNGSTWKTIGGPSSTIPDSRYVCSINENIIFAVDDQGSIWATFNSGGDSLIAHSRNGVLTFSQKILFATDTVLCNSIARFTKFSVTACTPPSIIKLEIVGKDSSSYSVLPISGDSLGVNFDPRHDGQTNAYLILTLSDGTRDTISLQGYGIAPHPLTLISTNQSTDTIGGSIYIPITISGLDHSEDIELVLHYEKGLKYEGSYSGTMQLDMTNEQWPGRSKLHISQAKNDVILGYAKFDVFGDSIPSHVTFDSVTILTAKALCQYILPASVTSTITPPSGCGIQTLTHFLRDSTMPRLSIIPNPTSGEVSITSTVALGSVSIAVYDMLGVKQNVIYTTLQKNIPAKILLPSFNGVYNLVVQSLQNSWNLQAVVNH
jgi:hypothetical protein